MNSWHLKYFIEASRNQSLQSAAQKYFVTPSAVSQAIKTLESELGVDLLNHQKRIFNLTPEGLLFLEKAQQLVNEMDGLSDYIKTASSEPQGTMKIAAPRSLFTEDLARVFMQVKRKYPKIKFQVRSGIASEVRRYVENGEVDFGLLVDDHQTQNFQEKTLSSGEFVMFAKSDRKSRNLDSLIVTNPEKIEIVHLFKELKKKKIPIPEIGIEILSWSMIRSLVSVSDMVGYVPDYVIKDDVKAKTLKILDFGIKPFRYETKLIWPQGKPIPLGAKLLLE